MLRLRLRLRPKCDFFLEQRCIDSIPIPGLIKSLSEQMAGVWANVDEWIWVRFGLRGQEWGDVARRERSDVRYSVWHYFRIHVKVSSMDLKRETARSKHVMRFLAPQVSSPTARLKLDDSTSSSTSSPPLHVHHHTLSKMAPPPKND